MSSQLTFNPQSSDTSIVAPALIVATIVILLVGLMKLFRK